MSLACQIACRNRNNLNIIRLLLALLVIFSHSFPLALGDGRLTGDPDVLYQWTQQQTSFGTLAVDLFFFISGFLITASWLRSKSAFDFFRKRVLRIYPGFVVAMVFSAAVIWTVCPEFRSAVIHPFAWLGMFLKDLLLLDVSSISLPGVFKGNPSPGGANGSLWTISIEFTCYLVVLAFGVVGLLRRRFALLVTVAAAYEIYAFDMYQGDNRYDQFFMCFALGAIAWLWQDKIRLSNRLALVGVILLLVSSHFRPWYGILLPVISGYGILWLAYGPQLPLAAWAEKVDLSYGTYLYAFPIQQVLAMVSALRHPLAIFVLAVPLALVFAWLSWHLVEKRFLALKTRTEKPAAKLYTVLAHSLLLP